jgi:hypothetical protein
MPGKNHLIKLFAALISAHDCSSGLDFLIGVFKTHNNASCSVS